MAQIVRGLDHVYPELKLEEQFSLMKTAISLMKIAISLMRIG